MLCVQRAHYVPYGLTEKQLGEHIILFIHLLTYLLGWLLTLKTGPHIFQAGRRLAMWARMTLTP